MPDQQLFCKRCKGDEEELFVDVVMQTSCIPDPFGPDSNSFHFDTCQENSKPEYASNGEDHDAGPGFKFQNRYMPPMEGAFACNVIDDMGDFQEQDLMLLKDVIGQYVEMETVDKHGKCELKRQLSHDEPPSPLSPSRRPTLFGSQATGCQPKQARNSCQAKNLATQLEWGLMERRCSVPCSNAQQERPHSLIGELSPGDVLSIQNFDAGFGMTRLGTAGGFMGHVLVVVSPAQRIGRGSAVDKAFEDIHPETTELYSVSVLECSRGAEGLAEVNMVLCVEEGGRVILGGEYRPDEVTINELSQEVHIWFSPSKFRGENFRADVMCKVIEDMRSNQRNWSWSTAIRAVFLSGDISGHGSSITMEEIEASWSADPICTSIVVTFWQRYFHTLAIIDSIDPLQLILQFMPLLADRVLPGQLLSTMLSRGWSFRHGEAKLTKGKPTMWSLARPDNIAALPRQISAW